MEQPNDYKKLTNADYYFIGNYSITATGYDKINEDLLNFPQGFIRLGPALDPHGGEYKTELQAFLIGEYIAIQHTMV